MRTRSRRAELADRARMHPQRVEVREAVREHDQLHRYPEEGHRQEEETLREERPARRANRDRNVELLARVVHRVPEPDDRDSVAQAMPRIEPEIDEEERDDCAEPARWSVP